MGASVLNQTTGTVMSHDCLKTFGNRQVLPSSSSRFFSLETKDLTRKNSSIYRNFVSIRASVSQTSLYDPVLSASKSTFLELPKKSSTLPFPVCPHLPYILDMYIYIFPRDVENWNFVNGSR